MIIFWTAQFFPAFSLTFERVITERLRRSLIWYYVVFITIWGITGYSAYIQECDSKGVIDCVRYIQIPYNSILSYVLGVYIALCFIPLLCCIFICTLRMFYRRRRPVNNGDSLVDPLRRRPSLIIQSYLRPSTELDKERECPVCFDRFEVDISIAQLSCNHTFHVECLKRWMDINAICPCCRMEIETYS